MKRDVELFVSPGFIAALFGAEASPDGRVWFDPDAAGIDGRRGQVRIPIRADVAPSDGEVFEGQLDIADVPRNLWDTFGAKKVVLRGRVIPLRRPS